MNKIFCGIDVGRAGGIALVDSAGRLVDVYEMPLTHDEETDAWELFKIISSIKADSVHIIFERLNSFFGMSQAGIIGVSREGGIVYAVSQISRHPFTKVSPKKWQNFIFANEKQIFKQEKGKAKLDTKKMAANVFTKNFPDYEKFKVVTKRTGNLRDGIVDAALLAQYGRMNNF